MEITSSHQCQNLRGMLHKLAVLMKFIKTKHLHWNYKTDFIIAVNCWTKKHTGTGMSEWLHVVRTKCTYTHIFIDLHNGIWYFRQLTQRNWKLTSPYCGKLTIQHSYVSTPAHSYLQQASCYISLQMNTTAQFMSRIFTHLGTSTEYTAMALQLNVSSHFPRSVHSNISHPVLLLGSLTEHAIRELVSTLAVDGKLSVFPVTLPCHTGYNLNNLVEILSSVSVFLPRSLCSKTSMEGHFTKIASARSP